MTRSNHLFATSILCPLFDTSARKEYEWMVCHMKSDVCKRNIKHIMPVLSCVSISSYLIHGPQFSICSSEIYQRGDHLAELVDLLIFLGAANYSDRGAIPGGRDGFAEISGIGKEILQ